MNLQITQLSRNYFQISAEGQHGEVGGAAGGSAGQECAARPLARRYLLGVIALIERHAPDGLSGLAPKLTAEEHNRFPRGRW